MRTRRIEGWALALTCACGSAVIGCNNATNLPNNDASGAGTGAAAGSGSTTAGPGSTTAGPGSTTAGSGSTTPGSHSSTAGAGSSTAGSHSSTAGSGSSVAGSGSGTAGSHSSTAGSGSGTAGSGAAGSSSGGGGGATFKQVYAIFSSNCAGGGCHISSYGAAGLAMPDQNTAYVNLVGAASSKCWSNQRVVAGNPDASVLYHALQHTSFGNCRPPSMPQGRPMLSQTDLATVQAWIMAGAMND